MDHIQLSSESKRRATLKKVNQDILAFINNLGYQSSEVRRRTASRVSSPGPAGAATDPLDSKFELNVIEDAQTKPRNTLSMEYFSSFFDPTQKPSHGTSDQEVQSKRGKRQRETVKCDS